MLKINYPLLDLLSQSTDSILYRNSTRWTSFTSTSLGRSLAGAASEAAARTLISAARTDGANTFAGDQIANKFQANVYSDYASSVGYFVTTTDSTHGWTFYNVTPTKTALTLQGASGQSRPLLELQDSLGSGIGTFSVAAATASTGLTIVSLGAIALRNASACSLYLGSVAGSGVVDVNDVLIARQAIAAVSGVTVSAGQQVAWSDVGIVRDSAGVLRVSDGSTGLGSLIAGSLTGTINSTSGSNLTLKNTAANGYTSITLQNSGGSTGVFFGYSNASASYLPGSAFLYTPSSNFCISLDNGASQAVTVLSASKRFGINCTPTAQLEATVLNAGYVGHAINLASGQTANGIEQRTSLGAVNFSVSAAGAGLFTNSVTTAATTSPAFALNENGTVTSVAIFTSTNVYLGSSGNANNVFVGVNSNLAGANRMEFYGLTDVKIGVLSNMTSLSTTQRLKVYGSLSLGGLYNGGSQGDVYLSGGMAYDTNAITGARLIVQSGGAYPNGQTNHAGRDLVLQGGPSIGNVAGGDVVVQTMAAGSSGSSANTYAESFRITPRGVRFPSLANAAADNDTVYYSTDASKLVYKDAAGVVNNLY